MAMDWQFAFERAEVLREFQTELLVSIGHELRTPLSSQMSALQMIVTDLCDSPEEEREYAEAAIEGVKRSLALLTDFTDLARQALPIHPLNQEHVILSAVLHHVYNLTQLQARDQGIRYQWPIVQPDPQFDSLNIALYADPDWLTQALLALSRWSVKQLKYGSFELKVSEQSESVDLKFVLTGSVGYPLVPADALAWRVGSQMLAEMGGTTLFNQTSGKELGVVIGLPKKPQS